MTESPPQKQTWLNLGLISVLLLLVAVSVYLWIPRLTEQDNATALVTSGNATQAQNSSLTTESSNKESINRPADAVMEHLLTQARHIEGSADAPVTIIEFSDFK